MLTAANGLQVVSPGDLRLCAGERVVLGVTFSVGPDNEFNSSQIDYDPTNGSISTGDIFRVGNVQ